MAFVDNLYYMGVGMASILIVMAVLILITMGLNKLFSKKMDATLSASSTSFGGYVFDNFTYVS